MLEASKKEIRDFANLLRKKLIDSGCHRAYVNSFSDSQILDEYRICGDCGEEIHTKDQQLRLILESDSSERAYELLYSNNTEDCLIVYSEEESLEDINTLEISSNSILDGARSLSHAAEILEAFKKYLLKLRNEGFELDGEIEDDYGFCRRK